MEDFKSFLLEPNVCDRYCFQVGDCNNHCLFFKVYQEEKTGKFLMMHWPLLQAWIITGCRCEILFWYYGKDELSFSHFIRYFMSYPKSYTVFCLILYYSQTGRRPSALWGAALYISAISHGLNCSKSDIVSHVWNICWCAVINSTMDKYEMHWKVTPIMSHSFDWCKLVYRATWVLHLTSNCLVGYVFPRTSRVVPDQRGQKKRKDQ